MSIIPINTLNDLLILSKEKKFKRSKNELIKALLNNNNIFSQVNFVIQEESIIAFIIDQQIWVEFEFTNNGTIIIIGGNHHFETFIHATSIPNPIRNFGFNENINELEDDMLKSYIQIALNISQQRESLL